MLGIRREGMSSPADGYDSVYREFDAPWMQQMRRDAYGEDIGQHSWVTADELRADIARLGLTSSSRLVDLGCGPGGPLTFILANVRCHGTGVELSAAALRVADSRARSLGVHGLFSGRALDLNDPLPFEPGSFDAAISLDVVLHLSDRAAFIREVARVLRPGGRFLFTDAGVVTGLLSNDEVRDRSVYGSTQFVPPGWNEWVLESAGFRVLDAEDRTPSVTRNASGRLEAMDAYRSDLERVWGVAELDRQRAYLHTVIALSERRALSRMVYIAEMSSSHGGSARHSSPRHAPNG